MTKRDLLRKALSRLLPALGVALAVAGTAFLCAWYNYRDSPRLTDKPWWTRHELNHIQAAIESHQAASGQLPRSLTDLKEVQAGQILLDASGQPVDIWGNPYQYRVENGGYSLFSFGANGRLGGVGLDADIYPSSEGKESESATLWQFTVDMPTGGIQDTCALAGLCAGLVSLFFRRPSAEVPGTRLLLLQAGVTVGAAIVAAVIMSALHLPKGGH